MTSVSEQLRRLALPESQILKKNDNKTASLLYDYSDAAKLDKETYYGLGLTGLEELNQMDSNFHLLFYEDLFSDKAKSIERSVQTKKFNEKLDKQIDGFLTYVTPYVPIRSSIKCIEWLIYRFHIAQFNTDSLVKCFMPYYHTNLFVRAAQLVEIKHPTDRWAWLKDVQKYGISPSTSNIITRCKIDSVFLTFMCKMMMDAYQVRETYGSKWSMNVIVNVFTTCITGLFHSMAVVKKTSLRLVMPVLLKSIGSKDENFQAAGLVILSQLSVKTTLKEDVLINLLKLVVKSHLPKLELEALKLIILFMQTQDKLVEIPKEVLNFMTSKSEFFQLYASLNKNERIDQFISSMIEDFIRLIYKDCNKEEKQSSSDKLVSIIKLIPISTKTQKTSLKLLVDGFVALTNEQRQVSVNCVAPVMNSFQQTYSFTFDSIISEFYKKSDDASTSESLNNLFSMSVVSVKHKPLSGQDISLSLALMHKDPVIQTQAIKQISASLQRLPEAESDLKKTSFIIDSISSLLSVDTCYKLIDETVALLQDHPQLLKNRGDLIGEKLIRIIFNNSDRKKWSKVNPNILRLLSSQVFQSSSDLIHFGIIHYLFAGACDFSNKIELLQALMTSSHVENNELSREVLNAVVNEKDLNSVMEVVVDVYVSSFTQQPSKLKKNLKIARDIFSRSILLKIRCSTALCCLLAAGIKIARSGNDVEMLNLLTNHVLEVVDDYSQYKNENKQKIFHLIPQLSSALTDSSSSIQSSHIKIFIFFCARLQLDSPSVNILHQFFISTFSQFFADLGKTAEFLSHVWSSDLLMNRSDPSFAIDIRFLCIQLLSEIITAAPNELRKKMIDESEMKVVRLLLVALASSSVQIRSKTFEILENHQKLFSLKTLVDKILLHQEEILTNSEETTSLLHLYFDDVIAKTKKRQMLEREKKSKELEDLLHHSHLTPFFSTFITSVLNKIQNPKLILQILQSSSDLYKKTQITQLSSPESDLLTFAIHHVTPQLIASHDDVMSFFYAILQTNICNWQIEAFGIITSNFYKSSDEDQKKMILKTILDTASTSEDINVIQATNKAFKNIRVEGLHLADELKTCCSSINKIISKKSADGSRTEDSFKRLITLLEMIQMKKKISNSQKLIGPLFQLLAIIMKKNDWNFNFDYTCQLIIASLENLLKRVDPSRILDDNLQNDIKVNLLVDCVQSCVNVQTCQQALLVLASIASFLPEQVLHTVMSVFTFIGNNLLQRDDLFSFKIISEAIKTILPAIFVHDSKDTNESIISILRVFVDAYPHIPAHRRSMVFQELMEVVGTDQYLHSLILLLIDHYMMSRDNEANQSINSDSVAKTSLETMVSDWCQIVKLFDVNLQLECVVNLLQYLPTIPQTDKKQKSHGQDKSVINLDVKSAKQNRRFILLILTFISNLLQTSKHSISNHFETCLESNKNSLVGSILSYIHFISKSSEDRDVSDLSAEKYHKTLIHRLNEILTKANVSLPTSKFLSVVSDLMKDHQKTFILHRSVHLFNTRITYITDSLSEAEVDAVVDLSTNFFQILFEHPKLNEDAETDVLIQSAAVALKHVLRLVDRAKLTSFTRHFSFLCDTINNFISRPKIVTSLLAVVGEMTSQLKAHCIAYLPKITKTLEGVFDALPPDEDSQLLNILLLSTQKIFSALPLFLGPALPDLMLRISILSSIRRINFHQDDEKALKFLEKRSRKLDQSTDVGGIICIRLKALINFIPTHLKIQSVLDALKSCCGRIEKSSHPLSFGPLLHLAKLFCDNIKKKDINNLSEQIFQFYLRVLDFRGHYQELSLDEVDYVESKTLEAILNLFIKLPEATFRQLFLRLHEWSICECSNSFSRSFSFYRCTHLIVNKLKVLFTPSASVFVSHLSQMLKTTEGGRTEVEYFAGLIAAVDTFKSCLLYCGKIYMTKEAMEELLQPLVHQLEALSKDEQLADDYVTNHVIPCIGELAVSCSDDVSWQPLNHEVLQKIRHLSEKVRCRAPSAILHLVERLGDEYRIVLPEMVPYFAELMEDESLMVETHCREVIQQLEKLLDESLQKYLDN